MRIVTVIRETTSPFPFSNPALSDRAFPFLSPFVYSHLFHFIAPLALGIGKGVWESVIGLQRRPEVCLFPFRSADRIGKSAPPAHRIPHRSRRLGCRAPRRNLAGGGTWECGCPVRTDSPWRWRWPRQYRPECRAFPESGQPAFALLLTGVLKGNLSPQLLPIGENYDFRRIHLDCVLRFT